MLDHEGRVSIVASRLDTTRSISEWFASAKGQFDTDWSRILMSVNAPLPAAHAPAIEGTFLAKNRLWFFRAATTAFGDL